MQKDQSHISEHPSNPHKVRERFIFNLKNVQRNEYMMSAVPKIDLIFISNILINYDV